MGRKYKLTGEEKQIIIDNCSKAYKYVCWRNPLHIWFVTLYDEKEEAFFEFQYNDLFTIKKDCLFIQVELEKIDERRMQDL